MARRATPDLPAAGHNSAGTDRRLVSLVQRIERLKQEQKDAAESIKEIYSEAKSDGYPVKALRSLIADRARDPDKALLLETQKELLRAAIGDFADMPLGEAALAKVA
jgi:uncharacterized protein (UPF0335 family)